LEKGKVAFKKCEKKSSSAFLEGKITHKRDGKKEGSGKKRRVDPTVLPVLKECQSRQEDYSRRA